MRRAQYRRADDPEGSAQIAQRVVAAKIAIGRTIVLRALRDHPSGTGMEELVAIGDYLGRCLEALQEPLSLDVVRGLEGEAGRTYFSAFIT